jgi:hypothetical protein
MRTVMLTAFAALPKNLGCENRIGLDHILIGTGITAVGDAEKVALGELGRTLPADAAHPDPLLALSDHCPLVATLHIN